MKLINSALFDDEKSKRVSLRRLEESSSFIDSGLTPDYIPERDSIDRKVTDNPDPT